MALRRSLRTLQQLSYVPPRGTHDTLHQACIKRRHVESVAISVVENYGAEEIITPTFDHQSIFDRALGATTDVVSKEMYVLESTSPPLVLRPEGTAAVARALLHDGVAKSPHLLPKKVWYSGSFYRRERPQKGRYRQFNQFGVELVGCGSWMDDVDAICMARDVLVKLGLSSEVELRLNTLGDDESRAEYKSRLHEWLVPSMHELSEESRVRVASGDVLRVLDSKREEDRAVMNREGRPGMRESMNVASSVRKYILVAYFVRYYYLHLINL